MKRISINLQLVETEKIILDILNSHDWQTSDSSEKMVADEKKRLKIAQSLHRFSDTLARSLTNVDRQWNTDFQLAKRNFREYADLVRTAYCNDSAVLSELRVNQAPPVLEQDWLIYARHFYTRVPAYNALLEQQFGILPEVWAQALVEIHALDAAHCQMQQYKFQAQQATQQLNDALLELAHLS